MYVAAPSLMRPPDRDDSLRDPGLPTLGMAMSGTAQAQDCR
jgi:hypothetical protein